MAVKNRLKDLMEGLMADPNKAPTQESVAMMATGERRGYRPSVQDYQPEKKSRVKDDARARAGATGTQPAYGASGMQPVVGGTGYQTVQQQEMNAFNTGYQSKKVAQGGLRAFLGSLWFNPNKGESQGTNGQNQVQNGAVQPPQQGSVQMPGYGQSQQMPPMQQTGYGQSQQMPMQQTGYGQSQQMPMQQTGYGQSQQMPMQQMTGYGQPQQMPMQQTGYGQVPQASMQMPGYGQQPYQQPVQQATGFGQVPQQQPMQATGYVPPQSQQPMQAPVNAPVSGREVGYQLPGMQNDNYQPKFNSNQNGGAPQQGVQPGAEQPQRHRRADAGNVVYMNGGNHVAPNGVAYTTIIHVAQPLSTATCYRIIEFMRKDECVLVNTELIKDPTELTRCLDLLFGAAFAMNCCYTRIASRSIYLITPNDVAVLPYPAVEDLHMRDNARRWPGSVPDNPYDHTVSGTRQEEDMRRSAGMPSRFY